MDAAAPPNAAYGASAPGNGDGASLTPDPLRRLAAELEATDEQHSTGGPQLDGAQLYEEAHRLLEEAWGIFTECQVMRDGLLAACLEIERTMGGIQARMVGLPGAIESNGHAHLANGKATVATSSNGTGSSSNGTGPHSNGNGTGPHSNGAGPHSNGAGPS